MKRYWFSVLALLSLLVTAQAQTAPAPFVWDPGVKVLIVGGGWAHDYDTWDNKWDTDLLHKSGITSTHYTDDSATATSELPHADVLLISCNKTAFDTPAFRQAVTDFVNAGKSIIFLHSGTFYSWTWDAMYTNYVGAGAHDHDGPSQFTEVVIKDHPITHGLPASFKITDELYHIVPVPGGSPMEILVEANRPDGGKFPSVWLTHYGNGKAKIVSIALGHDNFPRTTPEFSTLLVNAVKWAGEK
jgi:type 1 glutamine amidotransferase